MHQIKIERARKLSKIGVHPGSFSAMLGHISPEVVEVVTARTLARIIDDQWQACQRAKAIATREAVRDGYIWDSAHQRHREIAA